MTLRMLLGMSMLCVFLVGLLCAAAALEPHLTFLDDAGNPQTLPNVTFFKHNVQLSALYYGAAHYRADIAVINTYRCMHGLGPENWLRNEAYLTSYANADCIWRANLLPVCQTGGFGTNQYSWESTQLEKIKTATGIDVSHTAAYAMWHNTDTNTCDEAWGEPSVQDLSAQTGWVHYLYNRNLQNMTWENPRSAAQHNHTLLLWKDAHVWGRPTNYVTTTTQYVGTVPGHGRRAPHDVLDEHDTWLAMVPPPDPTRNYTTCEAAVENFYNQQFGLDVESGMLTDGTVTAPFTTDGQLTRPWFHTNVTISSQNDPTAITLIPGQVYNITYITPTTRPSSGATKETVAFCSFGDISLYTDSNTYPQGPRPWSIPTTSQCLYQNEDWERTMNGTYTSTVLQTNNIPKGVLNTFVVNGVNFTQHWRSFRIPYDIVNTDLAQICIANVFQYNMFAGVNHRNSIQSGLGNATHGIARLDEAPYERQCLSALKLRAFAWHMTAPGTCTKVNATQMCGPMVQNDAQFVCVDLRLNNNATIVPDEQCELYADPKKYDCDEEFVDECSSSSSFSQQQQQQQQHASCTDPQHITQFACTCERGYGGDFCNATYQWVTTSFEDITEEECVNIFTNQTCGAQQKVRDVSCGLIHNDTYSVLLKDNTICTELVDIIGEAPKDTELCTTNIAGTCGDNMECNNNTGQCQCQRGFNGTMCQYQYQWYATPQLFDDISEEECVVVHFGQTCGPKQKVREIGCGLIDTQEQNGNNMTIIIVEGNVDIEVCTDLIDLIGSMPDTTKLCETTMGTCGNGGVCTNGTCICPGNGDDKSYSGLYCEQNNNGAMQQYHHTQQIACIGVVLLALFFMLC